MGEITNDALIAESLAGQASSRSGEAELTDAIGEGLAAVARAVLDVANAIREKGVELQSNGKRRS
jgi:hypothetical protein